MYSENQAVTYHEIKSKCLKIQAAKSNEMKLFVNFLNK